MLTRIARALLAALALAASTGSASAALTAGTAFGDQTKATTAQFTATLATGNTGTVTYQWYQSTSAGVQGSVISGATAQTAVVTGLAASTTYFISVQYTDSLTSVSSNQVQVTTLASAAEEIVGGVGDSIMRGLFSTNQNAFQVMVDILNQEDVARQYVIGSNQGIDGSTTATWAAGGASLNAAISAFAAQNVTLVVFMLGTNDASGGGTPVATYQSRITASLAALFSGVPTLRRISIFSPPFSTPTSSVATYRYDLFAGYITALSAIANGTTIFYTYPGDSFSYFQLNPSFLQDGTHPSSQGYFSLGGMWAAGVLASRNSILTIPGGRARHL